MENHITTSLGVERAGALTLPKQRNPNANPNVINLRFMSSSVRVHSSEISFLQSSVNYCYFYLRDGRRLVSAKTLKYYNDLLSDGEFIRVHKSYLLNFRCIQHILVETQEIRLNSGLVVPIARRQFRQVLKTIRAHQMMWGGVHKDNVGLVFS